MSPKVSKLEIKEESANIKAVKVYQAVEFEGKLQTYFVEAKDRMVGLQMSIWNGIGVKMKTAKCSIVVPFANIAFIKDEHTKGEEQHLGREPQVGVDNSKNQ